MKTNKIKTVMCKNCNGTGEIIDKTDEWCGTLILECEECNGEGMIEVCNSDRMILVRN